MDDNNKKEIKNRTSQADLPKFPLKDVVALAEALRDNFNGKNANPLNLAKAIGRTPASSGWRTLTGSAVAYGITDGAYNSSTISLTPLGKQIVSPTEEGLDKKGKLEALLRPTILKAFYQKFNNGKLPREDIAKNILSTEFEVPVDRADEIYKIIMENARYVGIINEIGGGLYIQLDLQSENKNTDNSEGLELEENIQSNDSAEINTVKKDKPVFSNTKTDTFDFIENELAILMSKSIQQKAWLNQDLKTKVEALMKAAQSVTEEWRKISNSTE